MRQFRRARLEKLFISADGSKQVKDGDVEMCDETIKIIKNIDWPCKVYTNFSSENMDCRMGVTKVTIWFFENVEDGIILENDCLPSESFLEYCDKLLKK